MTEAGRQGRLSAHYFFTFGVLHQTLQETPDPSWKAKLRKTLTRGTEALARVAQVDIGGAAVVLTSHEIYKDKFELDDVQDMALDPFADRRLIISLNNARELCLEFQTLHDLELFRCIVEELQNQTYTDIKYPRTVLKRGPLAKRGRSGVYFERYAILLPQRLYILRSKAAFLPIGVISLAESKPLLDASGRTIHFKAGGKQYTFRCSTDQEAASWFQQMTRSCTERYQPSEQLRFMQEAQKSLLAEEWADEELDRPQPQQLADEDSEDGDEEQAEPPRLPSHAPVPSQPSFESLSSMHSQRSISRQRSTSPLSRQSSSPGGPGPTRSQSILPPERGRSQALSQRSMSGVPVMRRMGSVHPGQVATPEESSDGDGPGSDGQDSLPGEDLSSRNITKQVTWGQNLTSMLSSMEADADLEAAESGDEGSPSAALPSQSSVASMDEVWDRVMAAKAQGRQAAGRAAPLPHQASGPSSRGSGPTPTRSALKASVSAGRATFSNPLFSQQDSRQPEAEAGLTASQLIARANSSMTGDDTMQVDPNAGSLTPQDSQNNAPNAPACQQRPSAHGHHCSPTNSVSVAASIIGQDQRTLQTHGCHMETCSRMEMLGTHTARSMLVAYDICQGSAMDIFISTLANPRTCAWRQAPG
ncbi:hypothetical protein WJX73_004831 [Symbiochloris irregularis]|uniref:PH domain-containing protein n=1 Tax=Symbiochloris irregularis TaxID=706552 RepID=A0AAW1NY65_9CHLO